MPKHNTNIIKFNAGHNTNIITLSQSQSSDAILLYSYSAQRHKTSEPDASPVDPVAAELFLEKAR